MTHAERVSLILTGLLLAGLAMAESDDAHQWLQRMNDAVRQLDYEGHLVVQSGDRLDAMYMVHRVDRGVEKERVVALTGKPREIIRSDKAVACIVPGRSTPINVGRRPTDLPFSPLNSVSAERLSESYRIRILQESRVAGRSAKQLSIAPRDNLRYGYRLYIDTETFLPLRSIMLDEAERPVAQVMFVQLKINEDITPIEHDLSAMQLASVEGDGVDRLHADLAQSDWYYPSLPPGFRLSTHRQRVAHGQRTEHFIFSDGLATLSVYVQPARGDQLNGVSQFGAAKAVGRQLGDHEVIVVGEVPPNTLRWFALHIAENQQ